MGSNTCCKYPGSANRCVAGEQLVPHRHTRAHACPWHAAKPPWGLSP